MAIRSEKKTVYTCSDGKEFTDHQKAKDHEFDIGLGGGTGVGTPETVRRWLNENRNRILDYLGTMYDPEPKETREPFVKGARDDV